MGELDTRRLADGALRWTRCGQSTSPRRNDDALVVEFAEPDGPDVLAELNALKADFSVSDARLRGWNLTSVGDHAAADFRSKHPDVPDKLVAAFTW